MGKRSDNIFIITGGPGFGKTELVNFLGDQGFITGKEVARDLIEEQISIGGTILPWIDVKAFQQEVLKNRIKFIESVPPGSIAFSDRSIPDQIAFARYKGFGMPKEIVENANKFRCNNTVFVTPPWREIYTNDSIRKESYEEACILHHIIVDVYLELNYEIVSLPQTIVKERGEFIINQTKLKK